MPEFLRELVSWQIIFSIDLRKYFWIFFNYFVIEASFFLVQSRLVELAFQLNIDKVVLIEKLIHLEYLLNVDILPLHHQPTMVHQRHQKYSFVYLIDVQWDVEVADTVSR